ncbi:small multi-drug export protein [Robertmurraya sp. Marseille-Q9965]
MIEFVQQSEGIWQYFALFIIAMLPLLDIFFVIPIGIAFGMSPVWVGIIGFAGNYLMVLLLGIFFREVSRWRENRRIKKGITMPSKKETRARKTWERYGLPGLAIVAPIVLGADLAALFALLFGSSRTRVLIWMGVSLLIWSIVLTIGSVYGFSFIQHR